MDATCPREGGPPQVLITWPDYDTADERQGQALVHAGLALRLAPKLGARSTSELRELATGAVGAIVSTDPFDAAVLAGCPDLRVIARVGVGVDSIDLDAATRLGVAVTVTPGANEATVADHTVALMLAVLRRICEHDAGVRRGEWNRTGPATPWSLTGLTVGLVGYGRIGRLVGARLRGFSVRLLATDPRTPQDDYAEFVPLVDLLQKSDVVSIHTPLLPGTHHMIGPAELAEMQSHAVLINTSRGGIVDEAALEHALRVGALRGAGLDVFDREPPQGHELLRLPNVVLSPHIAGLSDDSIGHMLSRATASVIDVVAGRMPADLANPAVAEHPAFARARANGRDGRSSMSAASHG
jgi:phosphoglycerate dehydrogenase-like enzyme